MELKYLTEQRAENQSKMQEILNGAKQEQRAMTEEEIKKFKDIVRKLKKIMKQNGFVWEDTAPEQHESSTGYFHVPVNFYYIGRVDE